MKLEVVIASECVCREHDAVAGVCERSSQHGGSGDGHLWDPCKGRRPVSWVRPSVHPSVCLSVCFAKGAAYLLGAHLCLSPPYAARCAAALYVHTISMSVYGLQRRVTRLQDAHGMMAEALFDSVYVSMRCT